MPNERLREERRNQNKRPKIQTSEGTPGDREMTMKTANWPGLPGPTRTGKRPTGDKKIKIHPASEGI